MNWDLSVPWTRTTRTQTQIQDTNPEIIYKKKKKKTNQSQKWEKAKAKNGNSNSKPKAKPRNIATTTAAAKPEEHEEVFVEKLWFIGSLQWLASLAPPIPLATSIRTRRPSRDASVPLSRGLAREAAAGLLQSRRRRRQVHLVLSATVDAGEAEPH